MTSVRESCNAVQAAEKAAAQSNREISGYRIESISLTHERQAHYLRKHVGLAGPSGPLAGLQPGGSSGIADSFPGYPSAEQLGSISGFPSQLVSPSHASYLPRWALWALSITSCRFGVLHAMHVVLIGVACWRPAWGSLCA